MSDAPTAPTTLREFAEWVADITNDPAIFAEATRIMQEATAPEPLNVITDIIMSEPAWPRPGAIRRSAIIEKVRARLSRKEPSE